MPILREEGQFERNLSDNSEIPQVLDLGTFTVQNKQFYAVGQNKVGWALSVFNGKKWKLINC